MTHDPAQGPQRENKQLSQVNADVTVNRPYHYTQHPSGVEAIQIAEHFNFNLGNVIKYIWRADLKGRPIEDLKKAAWYLNRELRRRGFQSGSDR